MDSRSRKRPSALLVAALVTILALTGMVTSAAADEGNGNDTLGKSIVEVTLDSRAAIDALIAQDFDLVEYVREEEDGRLTVNVVVDEGELAELRELGYTIGATVEDQNTWALAIAERAAALAAEERSHESAESGEPADAGAQAQAAGLRSIAFLSAAAPHEMTINRVDYFQNYAGWFLSVEVYNRAVNGTGSTGPTVSFSWRTAAGSYGSATTIPRFIDTDPTPDVYMYNRILVRIGPASPPYGAGAAPTPPAFVRVASSTVGVTPLEAPVRVWTGNPLQPTGVNFGQQYFTAYMDPTQVAARFESIASEFGGPGGIAELITLPHPTNGYSRKGACVLFGTTACNGTPGTTAAAVYVESKALAHEGGNQIRVQFRNPGAANAPLSVSVTTPNAIGGSDIIVDLATSSTGAITSTAAQVRNALNADPAASALIDAYTYAGSAGGTAVQARALVALSDFLAAPASVPRGPFTMKVLRISADAGKSPAQSNKTGVFIFCQQHAREWVTPITCLQTAEILVRNYATDARTKELVDNLDIFILPSANPDGSHYSLYDFGSQRRNMTRYCSLATTSGMPANRNAWGVDQNRNSGEYSLFDGYFGASTSCTSDVYAGPSEYSEPESKNLNWVVDTYQNIKFANNVHTYGGYFMWAPGSYIGNGRISAPPPNHGIEAYFFAAADTVLGRIKSVRGTTVLPARTGPIADVLYSAAGNGADDMWYRRGIIAYSFEAGSDRFSSTTTGTTQSAVGFMPTFSSEGRFEAQEFAAGNYGLLESALEYEYDNDPPEVEMTGQRYSTEPIETTFKWINEPSVVRYTIDGTTPTMSSPAWERERLRGPGESFTFSTTTTVKWLAVDAAGNSSTGQAHFAIESDPPDTTATLSPDPVGGYYPANPTVTLTADDDFDGGGAGVEKIEYRLDGGALTEYSAPFQVTGDGGHTLEFFATDFIGNVEATKTLNFSVDVTDPTISVVLPVAGASYALGGSFAADYSCDDATSGVASCVGTVPSGSNIDTATVGTKSFRVDAADVAGHTHSVTRSYEVIWDRYAGFFAPIDNTKLNSAKAGSAIPVKFSLGDNYGLGIFAAGYPRSVVVACGSGETTPDIAGTANPGGSTLSYADGQYVYVWKTESSWAGQCRQLQVKLLDNTVHTATFRFK
jgi:hypothetical protein